MPQSSAAAGGSAAQILLAEDDAASRQFIATALTALGCAVTACADGASALRCARDRAFDLLILDRAIPAPSGDEVLCQLRADPQAASHASPAVATSAEWDAARQRQAQAAGFAATLGKPCSIEQLRQLLRSHLRVALQPLVDDAAALQSAGSAANLNALRKLFARDLAQLERQLPDLLHQPQALDEQMHRLCASAGFCGAPALVAATGVWREQLRAGIDPHVGAATFRATLQATAKRFADLLRE